MYKTTPVKKQQPIPSVFSRNFLKNRKFGTFGTYKVMTRAMVPERKKKGKNILTALFVTVPWWVEPLTTIVTTAVIVLINAD